LQPLFQTRPGILTMSYRGVERMPRGVTAALAGAGVLRLRRVVRKANDSPALRMTRFGNLGK